MVKFIIIAAAIALLGGIAWPLAASAFNGKPNEATRLVEATQRTNKKADNLNESFTDIIPPAPRREIPQYRNPNGMPPAGAMNPGAGMQNAGVPGAGGADQAATAGAGAGQEQQEGIAPTPTPDPYAHPSEHAVRDAMEFLNRLQTEMEPTQTEYIMAVEQLQRAWNPRYVRAVDEYKRFARKIDHADAMAQDYFRIQQNLTAQISSPKDRRRAEAIDAAEREVYLDWRDQAFRTLGQAKMIMLDLHDMNVIIMKQSLSAHFAALYEEFQTIPPEITMLHEELSKFRAESEKIQETFGVPIK